MGYIFANVTFVLITTIFTTLDIRKIHQGDIVALIALTLLTRYNQHENVTQYRNKS